MNNDQLTQIITKARDLYAQRPSHAPGCSAPARGTYCVVTALSEAGKDVLGEFEYASNDRLLVFVRQHSGLTSLVDYNAEHSTEEVLGVFDRAIQAAS